MDFDYYDLVCVVVFYVLYLIVYIMVGVVDDFGCVIDSEVIKFLVVGFCDFICIVVFDFIMWWDVFLMNKDVMLEILGCFIEELFVLQWVICIGDGDQLFDYFICMCVICCGIIEVGQDIFVLNFGCGGDVGLGE